MINNNTKLSATLKADADFQDYNAVYERLYQSPVSMQGCHGQGKIPGK